MVTGDFLFEPRKGQNYDKDDDHLAQMMELLGRMPQNLALSGKNSRKFFDSRGNLRRINGLSYWPLRHWLCMVRLTGRIRLNAWVLFHRCSKWVITKQCLKVLEGIFVREIVRLTLQSLMVIELFFLRNLVRLRLVEGVPSVRRATHQCCRCRRR